MAAVQRQLVHKQFNSPMGLYSPENIKATLNRDLKAFGSDGIESDNQMTRPLNLANSEVLRAVEEEEQMKCGYKRVAWPPASEERIVREFTPQPQTQHQPTPTYNQQQNQPSAAAAAGAYAAPLNQGPMFNNVQHNINSFVRETNSPVKPNTNQSDYEAFPPQTPETPIILKDKQFSRLSSQESNQANTVSYQQYQQPQNQSVQQQQQHEQRHYYQEQPLCKPYLFNQLNNQQQQQQQQHPYQPSQQNMSHTQQQYQNQEEHHQQHLSGWKPIRPPQTKQDYLFTGPNDIITEAPPISQQQYQNYHQPTIKQQQQYRAQSLDNYQQSPQQQYLPQTQTPQVSQNLYQQPPKAGSYNQLPSQQPAWVQQHPAQPQLQAQQQYQQPPWMQQSQQPQQYQQQQQSQYQNSFNQYNQAPNHHQQQQQQQQYPLQQNQFVPQNNQQQFNSYSQHQQQQHTVSHDQVDQQQQRGTSPGIITLRKEAPITQKPTPIYTSQPAAISFRESSTDSLGGSNMRGDLKWPPPEYKEAAAKENEERRKLALGPVCRPRKVNRDYTSFFAKNALSHHYPSYKVPPGTQHMIN